MAIFFKRETAFELELRGGVCADAGADVEITSLCIVFDACIVFGRAVDGSPADRGAALLHALGEDPVDTKQAPDHRHYTGG